MLIPNCLHIYVCICISVRFFWSDTWWIFNEYWLPTLKESRNQIPTHIHKLSNAMFCSPPSVRTSYLHIYIYIHRLIQWHESHMNMYITTILMSRFSFEFCLFIMFFLLFFGAIQHLMWDLIIDDYWWRIFIVIHCKKYFRIK